MNFKILLPLIVTLFLIDNTFAMFTSSAQSTNNTFSAAAVFPTPTQFVSPSPGLNNGDVVINEIMWSGSNGDTTDEWIELKNTTSSVIDLTGWTLEGAATASTIITIPSGIISANGFFLISNFDSTSSILNITPDFISTLIQLDNTGLQLILKNSSSTEIDRADDGSGTPFAGSNVIPKKSMERKTPPGDGTISTNWHTATSSANLDLGATESATPKTIND